VIALGIATAGLAILAVLLARLAVRLERAAVIAVRLVADVRAIRLAVEGIVPLAGDVARDAAAGEAALARLEQLKTREDGRGRFNRAGAGPVSLPMRPPPAGTPYPPPDPGSARDNLSRSPEERRRPGP
jgi:hypothetical protein